MVLANYQFGFRGLTFGAGTAIDIVKIDGLDLPGVSAGDVVRPQEHGEFVGGTFIRSRRLIIQLEGKAVDAAALELLWNQCEEAFTPKNDSADQFEEILTLQMPGQLLRRIYCRPLRRNMTIDGEWQRGILNVLVELKATDPRIYDDTESSVAIAMASLSGAGMTFNVTFPHGFGGAITGGQQICVNTGKFATPPTFIISGGTVDNPKIEQIETGKVIQLTGSLTASDTLLIDVKNKAIILNGTAGRDSWLQRPISEFFYFLPGNNTIRFSGTTVGTATLTAKHRSGRV